MDNKEIANMMPLQTYFFQKYFFLIDLFTHIRRTMNSSISSFFIFLRAILRLNPACFCGNTQFLKKELLPLRCIMLTKHWNVLLLPYRNVLEVVA